MPRAYERPYNRILRDFLQFLLVGFDLSGEAVEFGPVDLCVKC